MVKMKKFLIKEEKEGKVTNELRYDAYLVTALGTKSKTTKDVSQVWLRAAWKLKRSLIPIPLSENCFAQYFALLC